MSNGGRPNMAVRYDNGSSCSWSSTPPAPVIWAESFAVLRVPKLFNLRTDPYERADTASNTDWDWVMDHTFLAVPTQATFQELPPRQKAASFTVDQVMGKLLAGIARRRP